MFCFTCSKPCRLFVVITIGFINPPYSAREDEGPMVFTVGVIGGTMIEGTEVEVTFSTVDDIGNGIR